MDFFPSVHLTHYLPHTFVFIPRSLAPSLPPHPRSRSPPRSLSPSLLNTPLSHLSVPPSTHVSSHGQKSVRFLRRCCQQRHRLLPQRQTRPGGPAASLNVFPHTSRGPAAKPLLEPANVAGYHTAHARTSMYSEGRVFWLRLLSLISVRLIPGGRTFVFLE